MDRLYPKFSIAAVGGVLISGGKILLVKRGYPPGQGLWSVPGGAIEAGEGVLSSAVRELREETGLEAEPLGVIFILNDVVRDPTGRTLYHYLILDVLFDDSTVRGVLRAGGDAVDVKWFDLGGALTMKEVSRATKLLLGWLGRFNYDVRVMRSNLIPVAELEIVES